jgi:hypothetical protein
MSAIRLSLGVLQGFLSPVRVIFLCIDGRLLASLLKADVSGSGSSIIMA